MIGDPDAWGDEALALVFIAGSVAEAERAEAALTSAGLDYRLAPEEYVQGVLLSSAHTGLGFYVIEGQAAPARHALRAARLHTGIVGGDA